MPGVMAVWILSMPGARASGRSGRPSRGRGSPSLAGADDYLAEFAWSDALERDGTADEVVEAVVAELNARFGRALEGRRPAGGR